MSITTNKQAYFNYNILDTLEAGLVLSGPEVKSIKAGLINLKGSYINIEGDNTAYLVNTHISAYRPASTAQREYKPDKPRKLLLHKKQIKYLLGKSKEADITIIPLKIYLKHNLVKLEIGIAKGKKKHDKRETIKKRDFDRRKRQLLK